MVGDEELRGQAARQGLPVRVSDAPPAVGQVLTATGPATAEFKAPSGGGSQTLANVLALGNDANALTIANLADPGSAQAAATKGYVDTAVSGIPGLPAWFILDDIAHNFYLSGDLAITPTRDHYAIDVAPLGGGTQPCAVFRDNNGSPGWGVSHDGAEVFYSLAAQSAPALNGNRLHWYDGTAGAAVLRFIQKDDAGTVSAGVSLGCSGEQTSVGAAGAAVALPSTPTSYLKVRNTSGVLLVIPAYAAA